MAADTFTVSLRIRLQGTGNNNNTWGNFLNSGGLQIIEDGISGWLAKTLTADYSLTTASGATDEARMASLKFTSNGSYTVTIPAVSKQYAVWNASSYDLTITNGSASVTVRAGETVYLMTDGGTGLKRLVPTDFGSSRLTNVGAPTSNQDAATKKYVDDTAFTANAGILPGQTGNAGKYLGTDGGTASWSLPVDLKLRRSRLLFHKDIA